MSEYIYITNPFFNEMAERPEISGSIAVNNEVKIVDEKGNIVPYHETGEIWVRGPCTFIEYIGQPELTKKMKTPDGWFRTG